MPLTIALAGKGSSGKSSLTPDLIAASVRLFPQDRRLVVDADPHQTLSILLGHSNATTVGALRSAYERDLLSGAALREDETREARLEANLGQQAIVTGPSYDFLALGRWELPGSQCTTHRVLERALAAIMNRYDLAIIDHEAGIEHLGRYTAIPLDALIIVALPDRFSLDVAWRIWTEARDRQRVGGGAWLLLNRAPQSRRESPIVQNALAAFRNAGVAILGSVDEAEDAPDALPADHPWRMEVQKLWTRLLIQAQAQRLHRLHGIAHNSPPGGASRAFEIAPISRPPAPPGGRAFFPH